MNVNDSIRRTDPRSLAVRPVFAPINPLGYVLTEKCSCKLFRISTYKLSTLKSFRFHTYRKRVGVGGALRPYGLWLIAYGLNEIPAQTSSSMRSMARLAFPAISSGTRTCGVNVSSELRTFASVIVFIKAQTALGLTG